MKFKHKFGVLYFYLLNLATQPQFCEYSSQVVYNTRKKINCSQQNKLGKGELHKMILKGKLTNSKNKWF